MAEEDVLMSTISSPPPSSEPRDKARRNLRWAFLGGLGVLGIVGGTLAVQSQLKKRSEGPGGKAQELILPGFGARCPEYPTPYSSGEWPNNYSYEGSFPRGFVWGLGTASYQIEGAYKEDGRGASIWDTFSGADTVGMPGANCSYCCRRAPCPINSAMHDRGATGNVACDHYHLWRTDIALMKSMGLKHYRFSLSWPRLVPTGRIRDGVNAKAVSFYNDLINGLLEEGITPYVTLYHWDLPQGLLDPPEVQGWWSRDEKSGEPNGQIQADWLDYAELCFSNFGDRVKTWITFNEPWTFLFLGSGWGKAPSIPQYGDMRIDPWIAGHNVLNAHAAAVDLYRRDFQGVQKGLIGITNNCDWREPLTEKPQDVAAAERSVEFWLGWMSDPIFGQEGDYPPAMRQLFGSRLPKFTEKQKKLLNGSSDFFGLNHYGTGWAEYDPWGPGADMSFAKISETGFPRAQSQWLYGSGWGFRKLLNWVSKRYNRPPIFVTEAGWSIAANEPAEGKRDATRILYYANYTSEMRKAIYEDNVDVRGFFAWSLMDNFEWERGYKERFGTGYNDFAFGLDQNAPTEKHSQPTPTHQVRTRKNSNCWLEAVWSSNSLADPSSHACMGPGIFVSQYWEYEFPWCPRQVVLMDSDRGIVLGVDPEPGTSECSWASGVRWGPLPVRIAESTLVANFSAIAGPEHLQGFWNNREQTIEWGDGSRWMKAT